MNKNPTTVRRIGAIVADQTGLAFVLMMVSMVAVVSAAALAIDVGLLVTARGESQRAAEAAALAGAGWLLDQPADEAGARARAKEFGLLNTVRGSGVVVLDEDIDVILDSSKVRVRVNNVRARGTAIPTFFARVFGVRNVNVRTLAAAWAAPVTGVDETRADTKCLLPIALPDQWVDADGDGRYDLGENYSPDGTSYGSHDVGDLIAVKVSGSQNTGGPKPCRTESESVDNPDLCRELADSDNWRCWWKEDQGSGGGADLLGSRLYPAENCGAELGLGSTVWTSDAGGNKQSLVNTTHEDFGGACETKCYDGLDGLPGTADDYCETQCPNGSFGDLIRADSALLGVKLEWDTDLNCPVDAWAGGTTACYEGESFRLREVPLVAPDRVTGTGGGINTIVTDFAGVFVEKVACNYELPMFEKSGGNQNVYIRIVNQNLPGGQTGGGTDPGPGAGGTTLKKLQLIE
ncbi:MAG: pilus assembly protein TadG-related protein [Gemmatimonadota bacterium]